MDIRPIIRLHRTSRADVYCAVRTVPLEDAHRFGILAVQPDGRVTAFVEKPADPPSNLVSMGVYVFSWPALQRNLDPGLIDFGRDVLPAMVSSGQRVFAYRFEGYWQDVGTVESYWRASLDLVGEDPEIDMYDTGWLIYTKSEERAPALLGPQARVCQSLISHGCRVDGTVERSVLSPGVRVGRGATVSESIVMFDTVIDDDALLYRAIVDKDCRIGARARIGWGDDLRPNRNEPERLYSGITVVGKGAEVPEDVTIGRNCRVDIGVRAADFRRPNLPSGETVANHG